MHRYSTRFAVAAAAALFVFAGCDQNGQLDPRAFKSEALTQENVCADADVSCAPSGAHAKHGAHACTVCHKVAGRLAFDKAGPAYGVGFPAPSFDAATKTCSNVGCHTVPAGSFSFWTIDGEGNAELSTVYYGGTPRTTPSWYATGAATCTACHDNPPRNGSTGSNVWHSGYHGGQGPTGANNQCQLCHPDATSTNGVGTAITNPSLHANGVVNIQPQFKTSCFGCH